MLRVRAAGRAIRNVSLVSSHVIAVFAGTMCRHLGHVLTLHVCRVRVCRVATHSLGATMALPHLVAFIVTVVEQLIVLLQVGEAFSRASLLPTVPGRLTERRLRVIELDGATVVCLNGALMLGEI